MGTWLRNCPERTLSSEQICQEDPMKRSHFDSVALIILENARLAFEYPGHLVLTDFARLKKAIKRAYCDAMRGV